jgi:hypothetical protein
MSVNPSYHEFRTAMANTIAQGTSFSPSSSEFQFHILPEHDEGYFAFILDPPPALMLGACLLLGCSISSFAYRRQRDDHYQTPIFALSVVAATVSGLALGVSTNLIMLGLIPWSLCTAMVVSVIAHWGVRRCGRRDYTVINCCEVGEKDVAMQTPAVKV